MGESRFIEKIDNLVGLLPNYHNVLEGNEAQTRWLLIDPFILDCWGYSREDVIVEYSVDKDGRVTKYDALDYCVVKDKKPKILIEAKSLGVDLFSKYQQLSDYFNTIHSNASYQSDELLGVLTDGDLYLFFTDSKEDGILDKEPFFTIRLSCSEDIDRLKLLEFSRDNIKTIVDKVEIIEEYDLDDFYRLDMIEGIFNQYESQGKELILDKVSINRQIKSVKTLRTLYRDLLKEVNKLQPNLLYNLAANEESQRVEGSISDRMFTLNEINNTVKVKTKYGTIYATVSQTRKGLIDRIVWLLKNSSIGIFNVSVRLKEKV